MIGEVHANERAMLAKLMVAVGETPKLLPAIVRAVPPAVVPLLGDSELMVGALYENVSELVAKAPETVT